MKLYEIPWNCHISPSFSTPFWVGNREISGTDLQKPACAFWTIESHRGMPYGKAIGTHVHQSALARHHGDTSVSPVVSCGDQLLFLDKPDICRPPGIPTTKPKTLLICHCHPGWGYRSKSYNLQVMFISPKKGLDPILPSRLEGEIDEIAVTLCSKNLPADTWPEGHKSCPLTRPCRARRSSWIDDQPRKKKLGINWDQEIECESICSISFQNVLGIQI